MPSAPEKPKTYLNGDAVRYVLDSLEVVGGPHPAHSLVMIVIARHIYWQTGWTTLSLKRIAWECQFTTSQTEAVINDLVEDGKLYCKEHRGQTHYAIAGYTQ